MTDPQPPDLIALAIGMRPEWSAAPYAGHLRETVYGLLRNMKPDVLCGPLIRCYSDPETHDPRRLGYRGPRCSWWQTSGGQSGARREPPYRPTDAENAANAERAARHAARIAAELEAKPKRFATAGNGMSGNPGEHTGETL